MDHRTGTCASVNPFEFDTAACQSPRTPANHALETADLEYDHRRTEELVGVDMLALIQRWPFGSIRIIIDRLHPAC